MHEVVKAELAARRQGTHETKTRGRVRGGGAKPWRQKGTGRARQGTTRAPQWAGGGVVFGPHPRNYTGKVNRKARVKAIRIALSAHAAAAAWPTIDAGKWTETKTKARRRAAGRLAQRAPAGDGRRARRGGAGARRSATSSARIVVELGELEAADLVWARSLIVSTAALSMLEGGDVE